MRAARSAARAGSSVDGRVEELITVFVNEARDEEEAGAGAALEADEEGLNPLALVDDETEKDPRAPAPAPGVAVELAAPPPGDQAGAPGVAVRGAAPAPGNCV